jgi:spermidine/putrescine transport system substrate-binding protein
MWRLMGLALAILGAAVALAACGGDDEVGGPSGEVQTAQAGPVEGDLTISQWPGYIDPGEKGTVREFEKETGAKVKYTEDVNDNVQFFGKLQPLLDQGKSGGRSLFVVTDWMAKQMYDLGYLQELNHDDLKTVFENINPQFEESDYDPDRKYTIPWQGGLTGIWVDTKKAPEIKAVDDLFDPKYKGKVTMLAEMRDTVPLVMLSMGVEDPGNATTEQWLAAIDKIKKAVDSGQIRRITGNEYTEDLTSGNVVAAIGWSGDASLIGNKNAEWRKPTDGCDDFYDQMVIPVGAPNTAAALGFMNFVYEPEVQADIAAYVNYVTPVAGVQEIIAKDDPELAEDELIFPSEDLAKSCSHFTEPPEEDKKQVTEAFEEVVSG